MKARIKWIEGVSFAGQSESGHTVVMDGPPDAGRKNLGVRPMEMLLLGMGGCTAFDVVHILRKSRQPITDCVAEIDADRADTTSTPDMDIIAETGAPFVFARSVTSGGSGDPGPFTARGVLAGIEVACEHLFRDPSLQGRRVLVQGAGDVGANLIKYLCDSGAEVLFTEIDESLIRRFRDQLGLQYVPPEAVNSTECDIFAPCALGGVLDMNTIPLLKCRAVAGSANNQLATPDDAERLHARRILSAPDYVVNTGGAMAIIGLETQGWTRERAEQEVVESVQRALRQIFASAEAEGIAPETAARRIAHDRLSRET